MPAPNKTTLKTLDFYKDGQPFANLESANQGTKSLDFYQNAQPFVAVGDGAAPVTVNSGFFFMFM
jgi:hypothetical protein